MISNVAPGLCQAIYSSCRQGRLQSARVLFNRLMRLTNCLSKESPAALKFAMCLLGFMHPNARLPIVELPESAKAEVASALAEIGDEDLTSPSESWRGLRLLDDPAATFHRHLK
jgi:4-hydroxy-tetrahydrodipicolinate synthase